MFVLKTAAVGSTGGNGARGRCVTIMRRRPFPRLFVNDVCHDVHLNCDVKARRPFDGRVEQSRGKFASLQKSVTFVQRSRLYEHINRPEYFVNGKLPTK